MIGFWPRVALAATLLGLGLGQAAPGQAGRQDGSGLRTILLSIDAGADWIVDRLVAEGRAPAFAALSREGASAAAMVTTLPSLTAVAHATLWTGASPRAHGITGNWLLREPPGEHTLLERRSGFLSDGLRAEPIWLTAARAGRRVLVLQATGGYPFSRAHPGRLTQFDVYANELLSLDVVRGRLQEGRAALAVGDTRIELVAGDSPVLEVRAGARRIRLDEAGRFTPPLEATVRGRRGQFRLGLLEYAPASGEYLLLRGDVTRVAGTDTEELAVFSKVAGVTTGEGLANHYARGRLGVPRTEGGDGTAERHLATAIFANHEYFERGLQYAASRPWDLLVLYVSSMDVAGHALGGLIDPESSAHREEDSERIWAAYTEIFARCADGFVARVRRTFPGAALVVGADHGIEGAGRVLYPNVALREAGLLAIDAQGRPELARTKALFLHSTGGGVFVNHTGFKGGIVPEADIPAVKQAAADALLSARDPETGRPLFRGVLDTATDGVGLGFGGVQAPHLYPDPILGHAMSATAGGAEVVGQGHAVGRGIHGPQPWRRKLHAIFYAVGPGVSPGRRLGVVQAVDVAPTVSALLGIPAPPQSEGRPLPLQ